MFVGGMISSFVGIETILLGLILLMSQPGGVGLSSLMWVIGIILSGTMAAFGGTAIMVKAAGDIKQDGQMKAYLAYLDGFARGQDLAAK